MEQKTLDTIEKIAMLEEARNAGFNAGFLTAMNLAIVSISKLFEMQSNNTTSRYLTDAEFKEEVARTIQVLSRMRTVPK